MPIQQSCPMYKKAYRVPDAGAGKKVRCPFCQAVYVVKHAGSHPQASSLSTPISTGAETAPATLPAAKLKSRNRMLAAAAAGALLLAVAGFLIIGSVFGLFRSKPARDLAQTSELNPGVTDRDAEKKDASAVIDQVNPGSQAKEVDKDTTESVDPSHPVLPKPNLEGRSIWKETRLFSPPEDNGTLLARLQIESIDKVLENLKFIATSMNHPEMYQQFSELLTKAVFLRDSPDLSTKKPLGAYLQARPGPLPLRPVILVPIRDKGKLLHALKLPDTPQSDGNWYLILPQIGQKMSVRIAYDYAYLTLGDDHPTADTELLKPAAVFAPPGDALLAVVCYIDHLPPEYRGKSAAELKQTLAPLMQLLLAKMSSAQAAFTAECVNALFDLSADFLEGGREASFSLAMSPGAGEMAVQLQLNAQKGSRLDRTIQSIGAMTSLFGDMAQDNAALRFLFHVRMSEGLRRLWAPLAREITDKVLQDDSDPIAWKDAKRIFTALQPTIEAMDLDMGLALLRQGQFAAVRGGIKATSSKALEKLLQQKVKELPDAADRAVYHWDDEHVEKVGVHRLAVQNLFSPFYTQVFGFNDFRLAFRDDAVLWTAGNNNLALMQKFIRSRPRLCPPLLLEMNVQQLVEILPLQDAGPERAKARKHLTDRNPGRVRLALEGGPDFRLRLGLDLALIALAMESVSIPILEPAGRSTDRALGEPP